MPSLDTISAALRAIAPLELAADWDSVGLLVGQSSNRPVERVVTCLTLSPDVAREAVERKAGLVVTHHPLPFRPIGRLTDESMTGQVLLTLMSAGIAVYSPHTAWDSAAGGINDQLAQLCGLQGVRPIKPHPELHLAGVGRMGHAAGGMSVGTLIQRLVTGLEIDACQLVGEASVEAGLVGIVCGSGGDLLNDVRAAGCTTMVTGELRLHAAVEAKATGIAVVVVGHHASERFAMDTLAKRLAEAVPGIDVRPSSVETDPLSWIPPS